MATALDDAYFMIMTGVWKMSDLGSWVEACSEDYLESHIEEYEEKSYVQGHEDGYQEGIKDAIKAVKYLE